jgi:hypothetical protein
LTWVVRTIIKLAKWSVNQVKTVGVAPSPIQKAIADSERQLAAQAAARLASAPEYRQPEAGGPAVNRETTLQDFDRSEQELFQDEPAPLNTLESVVPPLPDTPPFRLFENADDLVRAVILQEVLGPPLSKRFAAQ